MADLGSTTIFGNLNINGSLGGAIRIAYCKEDAPADTEIDCYLDTDATGEEVTVQCITGSSNLDASIPRLSDGDSMFVVKHNGVWYSATIFEDAEDIDETIGLPKIKYIVGETLTDDPDPASPTACSDVTWAVSKSIIKAIRIVTASTNWDLVLWTNSSAGDYGMYDGGFLNLVKAASGDQLILLDLPYIDYDSSSSVHLQFIDNSGSAGATVDIYGVEAS